MTTLEIAKADGQRSEVGDVELEGLRNSFRGPLVEPSDESYDDVRKVWNGLIDRRPGLIARCTGAADVMAAVSSASHNDLLVAVPWRRPQLARPQHV
jgi:hypothetical protein